MTKQQVKIGDLILFFGWFRKVHLVNGTYCFTPNEPDLHVLFGWLQIGEMHPAGPQNRRTAPEWARDHPHFLNDSRANNYVYISSDQLSIPRLKKKIPGGGVFEKYLPDLRLTAPEPNRLRSVWQLPRTIYPERGKELLSYHSIHSKKNPWTHATAHTLLRTRAKGQEFVLHADECPEAISWARGLITRNG